MSYIVLLQIICGFSNDAPAQIKRMEKMLKFMLYNRRLAEPKTRNFYAIYFMLKRESDKVFCASLFGSFFFSSFQGCNNKSFLVQLACRG